MVIFLPKVRNHQTSPNWGTFYLDFLKLSVHDRQQQKKMQRKYFRTKEIKEIKLLNAIQHLAVGPGVARKGVSGTIEGFEYRLY
jgi:hypothetical protein